MSGRHAITGRSSFGHDVLLASTVTAFLAVLSVAGFREAREVDRDRWTATALGAVISLENALKAARPLGPGHLLEVIDGFESDGVAWVALVGPAGRVIAHSEPERAGGVVRDPLLDAAFATHEVQSGLDRDDAGKSVFDVFVPVRRPHGPGPGGPGPGGPPPHRGWLKHLAGLVDHPEEVVVRVGVEPVPSPLWRWVWMQAAASAAVIALVWVWLLRARRSAALVARLEVERSRREVLARLGEMSAVLAHEIRNPLAAMKGHLQLAAEGLHGGAAGSDLPGRVRTALDEVVRVEALVRGLLDYAADRPLTRGLVPLRDVVERAVGLATASPDLPPAEVAIEVEPGAEADCDPEHLGRALANVVGNAVEAAGASGRVRVTGSASREGASVAVEDSGPGLAPDIAGRAFDPFVSGKVRGVGLGLAIARRIVEAHGGTIEAGRSGALGGAQVTIRIPSRRRSTLDP
jgi:signal transduction histidine kinase